MKHKKQAFEQIERTVKWNELRDNTRGSIDWDLEIAMLQEELDELKEAVANNDSVGIFDALLDLDFVNIGTKHKFGLTPEQMVCGYEAVILANEMKGTQKNAEGKIVKPEGWSQYKPEPKLEAILNKVV